MVGVLAQSTTMDYIRPRGERERERERVFVL